MGPQAGGAVFDSLFRISEAAAALVSQCIERAVAEQAAEGFRVGIGMAGKIFTFPVLKKIIVGHGFSSFHCK